MSNTESILNGTWRTNTQNPFKYPRTTDIVEKTSFGWKTVARVHDVFQKSVVPLFMASHAMLDTLEDQLAVLEGLNDHASAEECEDALDNAKENLRDVIALAKGESK